MDRSNFWVHFGIAAILVTFAAVLGGLERWRSSLSADVAIPEEHRSVGPLKRPPEVLVRFKPDVSLDRMRSIAAASNDQVVDEIESVGGLAVIDDLDDADPQFVVHQYASMNDVEYAEPNYRIQLDDPIEKNNDISPRSAASVFRSDEKVPNDPLFAKQWALNNQGAAGGTARADIDAVAAWQTTTGSSEVVVAVLDSGVELDHEDLKNNIWTRPDDLAAYSDAELGELDDLRGFNGVDLNDDPSDDNGHGTHCAGIIGAEGNNGLGITGVNWNVKIMPLKFLGRNGGGTTEDAIAAINYAIERKKDGVNIRVISASWGSQIYSKALEDTIRAAGDAGILFIAAAGNNGTDNDTGPHYPSNYKLPNVVSVAAVDNTDKLASFSNFGVKSVDVAAPGKAVLSTWLGSSYRELSGTSMATPYVSGVAALIAAQEPKVSMADLRSRLLDSADKLDSLKGKVGTGGRICAANAVRAAHSKAAAGN